MDCKIKWNTELPLINDFDNFVLVTVYNKDFDEYSVEYSYINKKGVFRTNNDSPLHLPVVAWSYLPEPYKLNPL